MEKTAGQRLTLRIAGFAGAALFAFFFALTWYRPQWVEDYAASYLEGQVADHVDGVIDGLGPPQGTDALSRHAAKLYEKNEAQLGELRELLKQESRAQISSCLEQIRGMTPEMRAKLEARFEKGARLSIGSLQIDNARLVEYIQSGYLRIAADLKREIRGFTAINAIAFLLLVLVSVLKPDHVRELFVPGILLALSTLLCAYLYVFEQDWLLTLIQGSYVGKIYALYIGLVFLILCDVTFNRGRVTRILLRGLSPF